VRRFFEPRPEQRAGAMRRPRVSICMPAFNAERFLGEALDSVWAQTFEDFEVVVADDESTDRTPAILARQNDPRLHVDRMPRNGGEAAATNRALELGAGDLVKFLHADDVLRSDCLSRMVSVFDENPAVGIVFCRRRVLPDLPDDRESIHWISDYSTLHHRFAHLNEVNQGSQLLEEWIRGGRSDNWLAEPSGVMVRRSLLEVAGGAHRFVAFVDMEWWIRLMVRTEVAFLDHELYDYRLTSTSLTRQHTELDRSWLDDLWTLETLAAFPNVWRQHPELVRLRRRLVLRALKIIVLASLRREARASIKRRDFTVYLGMRVASLLRLSYLPYAAIQARPSVEP
jgi:glycosyltransferase involved in cell wall biosynthesis